VLGDGEFCQRCTCTRCGSGLSKGLCLICKHNQNSLNDSPSISENSSQSPPHINHHCCYECGDPLEGAPTNFPSFDSKSDLVHDYPNVFNPPPQLPFIFCEFYGNDACYGHYCTTQVLFVYPDLGYNQDFNFSPEFQEFHDFQQQDLCCEICGVTHVAYQCQKKIEDYYHEQNSCYDSKSFGFDQFQPQQFTVNHPVFNVQNDLFDSQNKLMEQLTSTCDMATESVEFIKSSVENLIPIPSESEGESECYVPVCEAFTTFLNILFDAENDFYSSDDQSFYDEDVPKKIFSNPLFDEEIIPMKIDPHHFNTESDLIESLQNNDSSIIPSSKIDSLFDEFPDELTLLKSILPGADETDCDPEEETYFIKRLFDSLMEEIDLSFTPDYPMSSGIEDDDYNLERDILILKDLLSNDSLLLPEIKSFHFEIPSFSRPPAKPPDEHSYLGCSSVPFLPLLINSSMGKLGQAQRPKTSAS
nr:hypothetical protein [Tanacetum cinerariifolium]